jgi:hypothetical protein
VVSTCALDAVSAISMRLNTAFWRFYCRFATYSVSGLRAPSPEARYKCTDKTLPEHGQRKGGNSHQNLVLVPVASVDVDSHGHVSIPKTLDANSMGRVRHDLRGRRAAQLNSLRQHVWTPSNRSQIAINPPSSRCPAPNVYRKNASWTRRSLPSTSLALVSISLGSRITG